MLANEPRSFYKSHSFVTGLSNCHELVVSILRTSFQKRPPKFVTYRSQKKLSKKTYLNYHVLLKQKSVRDNHAPFMTKELSKVNMNKPKAKTSYVR